MVSSLLVGHLDVFLADGLGTSLVELMDSELRLRSVSLVLPFRPGLQIKQW